MVHMRLTLTVSEETVRGLEQAAEETKRSRANLVALLLEDYLESRKEEA